MVTLTLFLTFAISAGQTPVWTWTLYDGAGSVVLANERPDTPDLRATLECGPGSGLVRISLYGSQLRAGIATISSGQASATVETSTGPDGAVVAPLRTDHPVFASLAAGGALGVATEPARQVIEFPAADLAKLRRFADLCSR